MGTWNMADQKTKQQLRDIEKALAELTLSPTKRKRILDKVMRRVRSRAQSNIRRQKDIHRKPFSPRKNGKKEPVLSELAKGKRYRIKNDGFDAEIGYKNTLTGIIAAKHQFGLKDTTKANELKRRRGKPNYEAPATNNQAKRLREAGFRIRRKSGKGYQQPSNRWVTENLTQGQFGAIYRALTGKSPKSSWDTTPEPRPYLGVTEEQTRQMLVDIITKETRG